MNRTAKTTAAPPPLLLREAHGGAEVLRAPGWSNLLLRGDNLRLMEALLHGPLRQRICDAGGLKLAYMDPPFAVGSDFFMLPGGKGGPGPLAYKDTWAGGLPAFLAMMRERLVLLRELLAPEGSLFLHCDRRAHAHLKIMLDEIFGARRFLGDIVWHYTGGGRSRRWFSRKHDNILHYAVSGRWTFNPDAVRVPYKSTSGYARGGIRSASGKRYLPHPEGTPVDDVWDIPMINPLSAERTGYPTQKPEKLLERIILAASRPGDLVADFFCGSGTTAVVARRLGRNWLAADQSPLAVHCARKRLLAAPGASFVLADLEDGREAERTGAEFPRARVRRTGKRVTVELHSFDAPPAAALSPKENPADRLDYWSVGLALGPDCASPGLSPGAQANAVLWSAARCQKRGLALCSPELRLPDGPAQLVLTLADGLARERRIVLEA